MKKKSHPKTEFVSIVLSEHEVNVILKALNIGGPRLIERREADVLHERLRKYVSKTLIT